MNTELLVQALKELLRAGFAGGVVFGFFAWFGKKWISGWIDQRFGKQVEGLKHEQQKELQQFKHQQDIELESFRRKLNHIDRIAEKEREVLPETWQLFLKAHGGVLQLAGKLKQIPNFPTMSPAQFEDFVDKCPFTELQKQEFLASYDREEYYRRARFWMEFNDAKVMSDAFNNYLALNSIFLPESFQKQFHDANVVIAKILSHQQRLNQNQRSLGQYAMFLEDDTEAALKELGRMVEEIMPAVQKRLGTS